MREAAKVKRKISGSEINHFAFFLCISTYFLESLFPTFFPLHFYPHQYVREAYKATVKTLWIQ